MKSALFLMVLLSCFTYGATEPSVDLTPTIDRLLLKVEKSQCIFIRNGSEHTGKEASEHIRAKYNHFKKQIRTTEDFIAKCATKSELSGKYYTVKLEDGKIIRADDWIRKMLRDGEAGKLP